MPHNVKVTGRVLTFSESVLRLNPELLSARKVPAPELQQDRRGALEREVPKEKKRRGRVAKSGPVLRITLISCRRNKVTDGDNDRTGYKELRDAIAHFFGLDDADSTIAWEYGQCETRGEQETLVRISLYGQP